MIRTSLLAVLALGAIAATAHAASFPNTVVVNYADLDLSRPAGAQILLSRLRAASAMVCGTSDIRDLSRSMRVRACVDTAMDQAVSQTHAPQVAALYGKPELVAQTTRTQSVAVAANVRR